MKLVLNMLAWSFAVTALVYCVVGTGGGVLYGNPLACLGVGLIGLGLCMDGRRKPHKNRRGNTVPGLSSRINKAHVH